jgi:hypothetical protein
VNKVLVTALGVIVIAAGAAIWLFPARTGAWILGLLVPYPAAFFDVRFTRDAGMEYSTLAVDHPAAHFVSNRAAVRFAPRPGSPMRIESRLENISIAPNRPELKRPIVFQSGNVTFEGKGGGKQRITLNGWTSPDLEFGGTILLERGRLVDLDIKGLVRLRAWQSLLAMEKGESEPGPDPQRPFEIVLKEGSLEVRLDGNTVFRSRWTMKKG